MVVSWWFAMVENNISPSTSPWLSSFCILRTPLPQSSPLLVLLLSEVNEYSFHLLAVWNANDFSKTQSEKKDMLFFANCNVGWKNDANRFPIPGSSSCDLVWTVMKTIRISWNVIRLDLLKAVEKENYILPPFNFDFPSLGFQTPCDEVFGPQNIPKTPSKGVFIWKTRAWYKVENITLSKYVFLPPKPSKK